MLKLIKSYPYDNNYHYVKTFTSKQEQNTFFNTLLCIDIDTHEYIKEHQSFRIKINYDELVSEGVNYITFNNGYRDVYAFIISKEYINEEVTRINYEIDVIQTFMFDFNIKESFIERKKCTIDEITDYDEGLEMGEHIVINNTASLVKTDEYFAMFSGFKDYFLSTTEELNITNYVEIPYIDVEKPVTNIDGVPYPLLFLPLSDEGNMLFFKKSFCNLPNLVGIIRLTSVTYDKVEMFVPYIKVSDGKMTRTGSVGMFAHNITSSVKTGVGVDVPKTSIFDFFPYTYYMITDFESEPLILYPQYLSNTLTVNGITIPSHTPIERYYPNYYKGSSDGKLYYIENNSISMLPVGTNGGIETITNSYASLKQEQNTMVLNAISSVADGVVSLATGNVGSGISQITGGINSVFDKLSRRKDLMLTPNTVKTLGTANTRQKLGTKSVHIIKYSIEEKYKNRIQNFIDRYGNKFNGYATIDIKNYKGFIKYNSPNLDTSIDNIYTNKIIQILERGVYIE